MAPKNKKSKKPDLKNDDMEFLDAIINPKIDIVVSRYNRDTTWTEKFKGVYSNVNVMIYDKENPTNPYNIPVNKGNEASTFLKYIVDYYDNLPEYTFFCHDEEMAWHHSGSIINHFEIALMCKKPYYNVNDKIILGDIKGNDYGYQNILDWYAEYIQEFIPIEKLPDPDWTNGYRGSAQFLVNKDTIKVLPKRFYEKLYNWIITTPMTSAQSGRYMEWTWHLFWYIYPNLIVKKK